jgi:hypothetical protein
LPGDSKSELRRRGRAALAPTCLGNSFWIVKGCQKLEPGIRPSEQRKDYRNQDKQAEEDLKYKKFHL